MTTTIVQNTFLPTQISGCQLWLDAADQSTIIIAGGNMTAWNDKSGNGNNAIAGTSVYPVYNIRKQNGLPVIGLEGSSDYFKVNNNFTVTTYPSISFVCVFNSTSANSGDYRGIITTDTAGQYGRSLSSMARYLQIEYYSNFTTTSYYLTPDTFYIATITFNGTSSITVSFNGTTSTYPGSAATFNNTSGLYLGTYVGDITAYNASIDIAEVLVYNSALTTAQRQQVEGYLAQKWGLQTSLPSNHPYRYSAYFTNQAYVSTILSPTVTNRFTNASFLPQTIPGCQLWLDAADRATMTFSSGSTTNVATWNDKSGNGNTATSFGTANPVLTQNLINGRQAISFPNTGSIPTYIFDGPISLTGASITYFVVFVTNTISTGSVSPRILSLAATSSNDWDNSIYIAAFYQNNAGFGAYRNTAGSAPISIQAATPYVFSAIATNGNVGMYQNGGTVTNITTGAGAIFNVSRYRVANQTGLPNEYFNGNIGEVIIYNRTLTTSERQQVEGYLAWKWILQANLPSNHPYKNTSAVFATQPTTLAILGANPYNNMVVFRYFNPTSIAAIALWLDGADTSAIQTSGSSVTQWNDKSGSGNNVTPYAGPAITLSKLNNQSIINFGTGTMYTPAFTWSTSYTMIFVALVSAGDLIFNTSTSGGSIYGDYVFTGNGTLFNLNNSSTNSIVLAGTDSLIPLGTTVISRGSWFIFCIGYNSSGTAALNYTINGTVRSTSVFSGSGGFRANPALPLYINGTFSSSLGTSQIAEVIHYNASITTAQRQQLEGYLAWKWGLQANLPATHPFKNFPTPP